MKRAVPLILVLTFVLLTSLMPSYRAHGASVDELQSKIKEQNDRIKEIEEEIAKYQEELNKIGADKKTLQNAINALDTARRKLQSDIRLTENRISSTNLNIEKLAIEIVDKEEKIGLRQSAMAETVRLINESDSVSLVESMLKYNKLNEFWGEVESIQRFQNVMRNDLLALRDLKDELAEKKKEDEERKKSLVALRGDLTDQKGLADSQRREKDAFLTETKGKESNYQKLLDEKLSQKAEFEKALFDYESQLRITIDPDSIPPAGKGVLAWPLDSIFITQHFGNTSFAKAGAYNGQGHNGMDFRASVGTRVKTSLSGTVEGTGNTDLQRGCYSYGKWVLVRHNNGLSTLYAHLSTIRVSPGDAVATGDVIGLSGNTGYSTGPHLHLTLYASQGVKIERFTKSINCKNVEIPVAPFNAYLNPLNYL